MPWGAVIDLQQAVNLPKVQPTNKDKDIFKSLLLAFDQAPDNEKPSECEKRVRDKYVRHWILNTLARTGVIRNNYILTTFKEWIMYDQLCDADDQLKLSHRSGMEMPWSGWSGQLKVNLYRSSIIWRRIYG